jgi:opacity protein-like surface antigen
VISWHNRYRDPLARCFLFLLCLALVPPCASGQWNASAYIGKAQTADADIHVINSSGTSLVFHDIGFDDRSFDGPLYYGIRGGYMFTPSSGLEGEFIHVKAFARVNEPGTNEAGLGLLVPQYAVSHGLNLLLANFVFRHEFNRRVGLSFRAGAGTAIPHPEIRAFGAALDEYMVQGVAIHFAGGAEVNLTPRLFWLGEYKFTRTRQRFHPNAATIENDFATHHLVTGFGFRF